MSEVGRRFYLTDVFGEQRYSGNQLATFVDCEGLSAHEMQRIAREINFSETTFVGFNPHDQRDFTVRIFTPKEEVPFAGHPVLGTAWVIREKILRQPLTALTLQLPVGPIPVTFGGVDGPLWMQQTAVTVGQSLSPAQLALILRLETKDIDYQFPVLEISTGFPHIIVPLKTLDALQRVNVDRAAELRLVDQGWAKSILVFAPHDSRQGQSLAVRVFAGYYGIAEDAATGSGNGALAAYLAHTRYFGGQIIDIAVGQGYEMGRPSQLHLRTHVQEGGITVFVGGRVIEVAEGVWRR